MSTSRSMRAFSFASPAFCREREQVAGRKSGGGRPRSRLGRSSRDGELPLADRSVAASAALKRLPAACSIAPDTVCILQARHSSSSRRRRLFVASGLESHGVRLRAPPRRPGRRPHQGLEPSGSRRRARYASARDDRHARRPRAFLQRVLRAVGRQSGRPPWSRRPGASESRWRRRIHQHASAAIFRKRAMARVMSSRHRSRWRGWPRSSPEAESFVTPDG